MSWGLGMGSSLRTGMKKQAGWMPSCLTDLSSCGNGQDGFEKEARCVLTQIQNLLRSFRRSLLTLRTTSEATRIIQGVMWVQEGKPYLKTLFL